MLINPTTHIRSRNSWLLSIPGDAGSGQRAPEASENASADFDLALENLCPCAASGRSLKSPRSTGVAVHNEPVGALAAQEHFEKQKRLLVVKRDLEIVGDDR